jgi:hypothetical protein
VAVRARRQLRRAIASPRKVAATTGVYDERSMAVIVAHIAGIPIEETLAMAIPVLGAASAAIIATLRSHRRKLFKRK